MENMKCIVELIAENKFDFSENNIRKLAVQIAAAIREVHSKGGFILDIRPENIFVSYDGTYRLGNAAPMVQPVITKYSSPEAAAAANGQASSLTMQTDIYSFGLCLYLLMNDFRLPFENELSEQEAFGKRISGEAFPAPENASAAFGAVILRACAHNTGFRFASADELLYALNGQGCGSVPQSASEHGMPGMIVPPPEKKKSNLSVPLIIGAAVLLIGTLILIIALAVMGSSKDNPSDIPDERSEIVTSAEEEITNPEAAEETEEIITSSQATTAAASPQTTTSVTTKVRKVKMLNFLQKNYIEAIEILELYGFTPEVEFKHHDTVPKDIVIGQSIKPDTEVVSGAPITLIVSAGPENTSSPYGYDQRIDVVATGSSAVLVLYEWQNDGWVKLWSANGYVGKNGVSAESKEGSGMTPVGTFDIGFAYGIAPVSTNIEFVSLGTDSVWVDDINSEYYNVLTTSANAGSAHYENTYDQFDNGYYSTNIYFESNGDGLTPGTAVPGKGSVITLCGCIRKLEPTPGCIDISSADMASLLTYLNADKNPVISVRSK